VRKTELISGGGRHVVVVGHVVGDGLTRGGPLEDPGGRLVHPHPVVRHSDMKHADACTWYSHIGSVYTISFTL